MARLTLYYAGLSKLKGAILDAYAAMSRANQRVLAAVNQDTRGQALSTGHKEAREAMEEAASKIKDAHQELMTFLSSEERLAPGPS